MPPPKPRLRAAAEAKAERAGAATAAECASAERAAAERATAVKAERALVAAAIAEAERAVDTAVTVQRIAKLPLKPSVVERGACHWGHAAAAQSGAAPA